MAGSRLRFSRLTTRATEVIDLRLTGDHVRRTSSVGTTVDDNRLWISASEPGFELEDWVAALRHLAETVSAESIGRSLSVGGHSDQPVAARTVDREFVQEAAAAPAGLEPTRCPSRGYMQMRPRLTCGFPAAPWLWRAHPRWMALLSGRDLSTQSVGCGSSRVGI